MAFRDQLHQLALDHHRAISRCIALLVLVTIILGVREWLLRGDDRLHVHFLSVGQGDSTLIQTPSGHSIVIDGGPDWSTLEEVSKRQSFFDRSIDLLIISHANLDHYAAFPELLRRYNVRTVVTSGFGHDMTWQQKIDAAARAHGTRLLAVHAGDTLTIDDGITMDILWPPATVPKTFLRDLNNVSIVAALRTHSGSILFTGDLESRVEDLLVRADAPLRASILKVPHHGSTSSSSTGFLLAVQPSLAVISVGKNTYGHPSKAILSRLEHLGIRVWRTDTQGALEVVW